LTYYEETARLLSLHHRASRCYADDIGSFIIYSIAMAPAITSPRPTLMSRNGPRLPGSISNSRETTPTVGKLITTMVKGDSEVSKVFSILRLHTDHSLQLASAFKSDLTDIRNLVTCSICDQLLYEPWTLGCGHTYCYSVRLSLIEKASED